MNLPNHPGSWHPLREPLYPETFRECLLEHRIAVVHFWAVWDNYDRTMDRVLQEIIPNYGDQIKFLSYDVDQQPFDLPRDCGLRNVPALGCFIRGQLHEISYGLLGKEPLESLLDRWLAMANS